MKKNLEKIVFPIAALFLLFFTIAFSGCVEREPYAWPIVKPSVAASPAASVSTTATLFPSPIAEAEGLRSFKSWAEV
ncbi:MAG: hypothetical protein QW343_03370, partial [Candidatus Norongarragalinales archaeon]